MLFPILLIDGRKVTSTLLVLLQVVANESKARRMTVRVSTWVDVALSELNG